MLIMNIIEPNDQMPQQVIEGQRLIQKSRTSLVWLGHFQSMK